MAQALELPPLPTHLVSEIQAGRCVAFLGAGFSAAARLPGWGQLLLELAEHTDGAVAASVGELVARGNAHSLDQAAQALEDALGREAFVAHIARRLGAPTLGEAMARRLEWLKGIPFRAVLTTNFDGILDGAAPTPESYRSVLRPRRHRWWEDSFWNTAEGAFRVKLHGDTVPGAKNDLVFTRLDYRRRLYSDPAYTTFLRAVFASNTVVYMGFSFEDAYLNELRSEVLALLGYRGHDEPVAYAIINDVAAAAAEHYRRHEGIQILTYNTHLPDGGRDFSGFDRYLEAIYQATNPRPRFGRLLAGRRLLWIDPTPDNNQAVIDFLAKAAQESGSEGAGIDLAATWEEGIERLAGGSYQLAISHWGHGLATAAGGPPTAVAVRLLETIRSRDLRCPVLIFGSGRDVANRKRLALSLGARAYTYSWTGLMRGIAAVFDEAEDEG